MDKKVNEPLPQPSLREVVLIPRSVYLKILSTNFTDIDINTQQSIPTEIYNKCDEMLGVEFRTVVCSAERSFKCEVVNYKKWMLARLKYGI